MKSYAMPLAIAIVGFGLMSIGFNLTGNQAVATPAHFDAGPAEPTIVWYGSHDIGGNTDQMRLIRAWSDGTVEVKVVVSSVGCNAVNPCSWQVISSPNEGLNAAADINFDSRVNAEDLGIMLAAWGDAPRNDYPPSDCPLGLIP